MTTTAQTTAGEALSPRFAERAPARLTDAQRAAFARNGYLVLEDALTAEEVSYYRAAVDKLDRSVGANHAGKLEETQRQPGDALELRNAVAHDPAFIDLMVHPRTFPLVAQLMNGHIALTTSHVFLRPQSPRDATREYKQIGWHRDGPAYPIGQGEGVLPWLYTKIGYFLTDTRLPDCGALRVVPGSHRYGGPAPQEDGACEPLGDTAVAVPAGAAVIFDNRVMHAVGPNFSNVTRENIYMGYCWRALRPIDFSAHPAAMLEEATPIQRQLLGDASSALGYYLPQGEADVPLVAWLMQHLADATQV